MDNERDSRVGTAHHFLRRANNNRQIPDLSSLFVGDQTSE